jgi:plasmid stability protein
MYLPRDQDMEPKMPTLQLTDVPEQVYEHLRAEASEHDTSIEQEAVRVLAEACNSSSPTPSERRAILEEMRRHRTVLAPGSPSAVELLREDRSR